MDDGLVVMRMKMTLMMPVPVLRPVDLMPRPMARPHRRDGPKQPRHHGQPHRQNWFSACFHKLIGVLNGCNLGPARPQCQPGMVNARQNQPGRPVAGQI